MPAPDSGMTVVAAAPTGPVPSNVVPASQHPSSDGSGPGVIPGAVPAGPSIGTDTGSGPAARMGAAPLAPETSTSGLVRTVQTPEIDRAQLMLDDEPLEPPSSKKGLVVGLLAGVGVLGLVLAIALGSSDDDEKEAKGKPEPPRVITAKQPEPEPTPPKTTSPVVTPDPTTPEPATPEPEPIDPDVVVEPEPEPATPEPEPKPKTTKPRPKSSEPAPLTDKKVRWRLSRALKKKCKSQATGPVTVELLVGSGGKVLSKSFPGASSGLKSCMTGVVSGTKFPEGTTRKQSFKVDF